MITIEGKNYKLRPQEPQKQMSPKLASILAMAFMFGGGINVAGSGSSKPREYHESDYIAKEYELILQKKSKKSYNQRQYIISQFNDRFVEVEPNA